MLSRSPAESNSTYVVDSLDAYLEKYIEVMALRGKVEQLKPLPQWVGLTKEEAKEISLANRPYVIDMIAALEARLKEKNT
jgi:hypothetical protein